MDHLVMEWGTHQEYYTCHIHFCSCPYYRMQSTYLDIEPCIRSGHTLHMSLWLCCSYGISWAERPIQNEMPGSHCPVWNTFPKPCTRQERCHFQSDLQRLGLRCEGGARGNLGVRKGHGVFTDQIHKMVSSLPLTNYSYHSNWV